MKVARQNHTGKLCSFRRSFPDLGESAVPDKNAESSGVEVRPPRLRNSVDNTGQAERVIRSVPGRAGQRQACRRRVAIRKLIRFLGAVGDACASEYAQIGRDFLFQVHADAGPGLTAPDKCYVDRRIGSLRKRDGIVETSHTAARKKARDATLPGLPRFRADARSLQSTEIARNWDPARCC